jgi:DNA-binding transcriptional ArsR family regulator
MPQNKSFLFPSTEQKISQYAQALAHPARLEIIDLLGRYEFLMHKEIIEFIPLSANSVSQHLKTLCNAQILIKDTFAGAVGYRVNDVGWQSAKSSLKTYFSKVG